MKTVRDIYELIKPFKPSVLRAKNFRWNTKRFKLETSFRTEDQAKEYIETVRQRVELKKRPRLLYTVVFYFEEKE